jgi:hypothetical protein
MGTIGNATLCGALSKYKHGKKLAWLQEDSSWSGMKAYALWTRTFSGLAFASRSSGVGDYVQQTVQQSVQQKIIRGAKRLSLRMNF